jgi:hypothetical protein
MMFKFWFTNSKKLRAVIEGCVANSTRCKATAWASTFIQYYNVMSVAV